jgi:hypothetical protein
VLDVRLTTIAPECASVVWMTGADAVTWTGMGCGVIVLPLPPHPASRPVKRPVNRPVNKMRQGANGL